MAKKTDKKVKKKTPAALPKKKVAAKPAKKPVGKKIVAKPAPVAKKAVTKKAAKPAKAKKVVVAKAVPPKKTAPVIKPAEPKKSRAKEVEEVEPVAEVVAPEEAGEELAAAEETEGGEEVVLTDAEGRRYCRVKDCDQLAVVDGYCRFHYLLYWKKIQIRKKILSEGKLERYIEELTARYPDKFLDMLRKDLRSEKEFLAAIQELEIDESAVDSEFEDETQTYIDEVRGMGETGGTREEEDF